MNLDNRGGFHASADDVVHAWAMFRLLERTISHPNGEDFQRTFVSTPGAVAIVAVDPDMNVVLVSQYRSSLDAMVLELPAGMRDVEDEDPFDTAARELKEETGYEADGLSHLGSCLSSPGVTDSRVEIYFASEIRGGQMEPHGPEEGFMDVIVVPLREAVAMVEDGRIIDAKTSFGLLLAARRYPELLG